jgi:hypothetical protein
MTVATDRSSRAPSPTSRASSALLDLRATKARPARRDLGARKARLEKAERTATRERPASKDLSAYKDRRDPPAHRDPKDSQDASSKSMAPPGHRVRQVLPVLQARKDSPERTGPTSAEFPGLRETTAIQDCLVPKGLKDLLAFLDLRESLEAASTALRLALLLATECMQVSAAVRMANDK